MPFFVINTRIIRIELHQLQCDCIDVHLSSTVDQANDQSILAKTEMQVQEAEIPSLLNGV